MHQVGLAEADPAVQEERVVGVPGALRHGQRRGMREPVGRPDDEVGERVARVEVGRAALAADPGRLEADRLGGRGRTLDPVARSSWAAGADAARGAGCRGRRGHELDDGAVADDPGQRLGDERPVARLEPVLGEPVRDRDPEPVVVDIDERRVAEPGLEVGGREGHLELAQGGAPDLSGVHAIGSVPVSCGGLDG